MKEIKLVCPKCGKEFYYDNFVMWVLCCPFHWFGKRLTKCPRCKEKSYMKKCR